MRKAELNPLYYFGPAVNLDLEVLEARLVSLPQVAKAAVSQEVHDELVIAVSGHDTVDPEELGNAIEQLIQTMQAEAIKPKKPYIVISGCPGVSKSYVEAMLRGRADVIFMDEAEGLPTVHDFKAPAVNKVFKDMPIDFEVAKAHLNYEEKEKLKTKGCRSKRRRKW